MKDRDVRDGPLQLSQEWSGRTKEGQCSYVQPLGKLPHFISELPQIISVNILSQHCFRHSAVVLAQISFTCEEQRERGGGRGCTKSAYVIYHIMYSWLYSRGHNVRTWTSSS